MLKLVINNTKSDNKKDSFQGHNTKTNALEGVLQHASLMSFQRISNNLYIFRPQDFIHGLSCEMTVELKEIYASSEEGEESGYLVPVVFCNFPSIDPKPLNEKICWDDDLQGIIMVQFQLKILEQLLLFCEEVGATHLTLTIHDRNDDYVEIYRPFALSEGQVVMAEGEQIEITMSTDGETYDEVIDFIDGFDEDFWKTLWRHQKVNPVFRQYLLDHSLSAQQ